MKTLVVVLVAAILLVSSIAPAAHAKELPDQAVDYCMCCAYHPACCWWCAIIEWHDDPDGSWWWE